jgi:hypothetical protein
MSVFALFSTLQFTGAAPSLQTRTGDEFGWRRTKSRLTSLRD